MAGMALILSGCAAQDSTVRPAAPTTATQEAPLVSVPGAYLGRAGESKVFLAVVPGDNAVRVYACDGEDLAHATVDQWFQGAFDGTGPVTLSAGAFKLTLRAASGAFSGEFYLDGKALPFVATKPVEGSALLDAEVRDPKTGAVTRDGNVIVLGGEQRGAMAPVRMPKCRAVQVTTSGGGSSWVVVC